MVKNFASEGEVGLGVKFGNARAEDGDGWAAAVERAASSQTVDTEREAGDDQHAGFREIFREIQTDFATVRGGTARTDDTDGGHVREKFAGFCI